MLSKLAAQFLFRETTTRHTRTFRNTGTFILTIPKEINVIWVEGCGAGGGGGGGAAGGGGGSGGGAAHHATQVPVWIPRHSNDVQLYIIIPDGGPGGNGSATIGTAGSNGSAGGHLYIRYASLTGVILCRIEGGYGGLGAPVAIAYPGGGGIGAANANANSAYSGGIRAGGAINSAGGPGSNPNGYVFGLGLAGCIVPGGSAGSGGGWDGNPASTVPAVGAYSGYPKVGLLNFGLTVDAKPGAYGGTGGAPISYINPLVNGYGVGGPPIGTTVYLAAANSAAPGTGNVKPGVYDDPSGPLSLSATSPFVGYYTYSNAGFNGAGGGGGGTGVAGGAGGAGFCSITW